MPERVINNILFHDIHFEESNTSKEVKEILRRILTFLVGNKFNFMFVFVFLFKVDFNK
jgi:hypothetical protein